MLFNSYDYLVFFLPVTLLGFFLAGRRPVVAQVWLVLASLVFYGWWNPKHLPLLAASVAFNFVVSQMLARPIANRRMCLALAIGANLVVLAVFKYADFLVETVSALTDVPIDGPHLALPLGISFFTFTQIAYLVDTYYGSAKDSRPENYALFVSFFPHLLAGPIIHHSEMMPQFASSRNKAPQAANLAAGLFLLSIGLGKKVLLADQFAPIADYGFAHAAALSPLDAWAAALAYAMQIYFDFSGYTDMALGAARMFNIHLPINFNSPYRSTSVREFWRRWHMTLSRFLRQYLYIPLGGNRKGETSTLVNLLITFALGGLWHGAAWTFVVWGVLHGVAVAWLRIWDRFTLRAAWGLPPPVAWGMTFVFVAVTWVFFRAHSLHDALSIARTMFGLGISQGAPSSDWASFWSRVESLSSVATLLSSSLSSSAPSALLSTLSVLPLMIGLVIVWLPRNSNAMTAEFRPTLANALFVIVVVPLCVLQLGRTSPFLYFNF
jgi:alginate O-acetyltransferase complex protein AlgI